MLPIVWVYIVFMIFGWSLLFYLETKRRLDRHVKGCPSLPYISPERLDSLVLIESDLVLVQLSSKAVSGDSPKIPDALRVPIDQLDHFLSRASPRSIFVLYGSLADPVDWVEWKPSWAAIRFTTSTYLKAASKLGKTDSEFPEWRLRLRISGRSARDGIEQSRCS